MLMLNKLAGLFTGSVLLKSSKPSPEQLYLQENNIQFDPEQGYIVDGIVVNQLSERLAYFSNRKLNNFDDLKTLYFTAILINKKLIWKLPVSVLLHVWVILKKTCYSSSRSFRN